MHAGIVLALLAAGAAAASEAARVSLIGGGETNVTVLALHASSTPPLPAEPLRLVASPSACALPKHSLQPDGSSGPFALLLERGGCSFDVKMGLAVAAGASVLIVADTLTYRAALPGANASRGGEADTTSPPWMLLSGPCSVDCARGSILLNTTALSRRDVLSGLQAQCASVCGGLPCGFADPIPPKRRPGAEASSSRALAWVGRRLVSGSPPPPVWPVRRACCAVDEAIDMQISDTVSIPATVSIPVTMPIPATAPIPVSALHGAGEGDEVFREGNTVAGAPPDGSASAILPALFLPLSSATHLLAAAGPAAYAPPTGITPPPRLLLRPGLAGHTGGGGRPGWDGSSWAILFLGTGIAALAAAAGARHAAAGGGAGGHTRGDAEALQMSAGMALGFLGMASALLLGLYVLLQARPLAPSPLRPCPFQRDRFWNLPPRPHSPPSLPPPFFPMQWRALFYWGCM
jgi:hypothetical protein